MKLVLVGALGCKVAWPVLCDACDAGGCVDSNCTEVAAAPDLGVLCVSLLALMEIWQVGLRECTHYVCGAASSARMQP